MMVIRPVRKEDYEGIERCATTTSPGMTHLPKCREALKREIECSLDSFAKSISEPNGEDYFFVLSDHISGEVGGTCGIQSRTAFHTPFYPFQIEELSSIPGYPKMKDNRLLTLKKYFQGPSEICALYLLPEYRSGGLGKLLSLSRFLFIANYPERFTPFIMANMRGFIENRTCPFWEGIGRHFFPVSFEEVMSMRAKDEAFLIDILPKHPLYVALLPPEVQAVIGKTHPHTTAALQMLQREGFQFIQEIDPVDGGPLIAAKKEEIKSISNSMTGHLEKIASDLIPNHYGLIANCSLNFRVCYGNAKINEDRGVTLHEMVAEALDLQIGDPVRYLSISKEHS